MDRLREDENARHMARVLYRLAVCVARLLLRAGLLLRLRRLLEALGEAANMTKNPVVLTEFVRQTLRRVVAKPFLNTAGDLNLLPKVLDAASRFERRPTDEAMASMVESQRLTSLFGLPT